MNKDNIIKFPKEFEPRLTNEDIPVEGVLKGAWEEGLEETVVIGYNKEGEFYFASSKADGANVLWLLELAKKRLLRVAEQQAGFDE